MSRRAGRSRRRPPTCAAMVRRGLELGLRVLLCDVLPWNAGYPRFDRAVLALNALVAAVADEEGVVLVPFHDTLEDPARPGRMRDDWVADSDHPSVAGYRRLAEVAVVPALDRLG